MEDDKALRKLLNEGALMKASAEFSGKVMAGINGLQTRPASNTKKWKQVFTLLVSLSVVATILLSFFINPASLPYPVLQTLHAIPSEYLLTTAEYLVAFWLLIALSFRMNISERIAQKSNHPSYIH